MRQRRRATRKYSRQRQQQRGGFLNRYDFVYAGRDTVNEVGEIVPGLIKNTSAEINDITQ